VEEDDDTGINFNMIIHKLYTSFDGGDGPSGSIDDDDDDASMI